MTDTLRVLLEVGPKGKRVVANALEWPGLERSGKTDDDAIAKLTSYRPRYAVVAERAGLGSEFKRQQSMDVVERYIGNTSTDYWGIGHVASESQRQTLSAPDLEKRLALMAACWAYFDDVASRVSADLRSSPRGGGWTRDELIRHVHLNEPEQSTRKVEVRTGRDVMLDPDGRAAHREATMDAIRAYNADGKPVGRSSSVQFLIRRITQHVMDHAWEMEDRDLTPSAPR